MSFNIFYGEHIYVNTFNVIVLGNSSNRNEVTSSVRNDIHKIKAYPSDITQAIRSPCRVVIHLYKNFTAEIGAYQGDMLKFPSLLVQRQTEVRDKLLTLRVSALSSESVFFIHWIGSAVDVSRSRLSATGILLLPELRPMFLTFNP